MMESDIDIVRSCFKAFENKDRGALELIIGDEFHFTSPLDNAINREKYFERCWPVSESIESFTFKNLAAAAGRVFVTYESVLRNGKTFRNTEIFEIVRGKVLSIEVYFGWDLPHSATSGNFVAEKMEATPRNRREPDPAYGDGTEA